MLHHQDFSLANSLEVHKNKWQWILHSPWIVITITHMATLYLFGQDGFHIFFVLEGRHLRHRLDWIGEEVDRC